MSDAKQTYFITQGDDYCKIGVTKNITHRMSGLQTSSPQKLHLRKTLQGDVERSMHDRFSHLRVRGEWFRYEGALREFVERPTRACSPIDASVFACGGRSPDGCEVLSISSGVPSRAAMGGTPDWTRSAPEAIAGGVVFGATRAALSDAYEIATSLRIHPAPRAAVPDSSGSRRNTVLRFLVHELGLWVLSQTNVVAAMVPVSKAARGRAVSLWSSTEIHYLVDSLKRDASKWQRLQPIVSALGSEIKFASCWEPEWFIHPFTDHTYNAVKDDNEHQDPTQLP